MSVGESMFTAEEIAAEAAREEAQRKEYEAKLNNGFFTDGGVRKVTIANIEKEEKTSQKGNNYVLHTYYLEDVTTGETEKVVDRNFAFTNAMSPVKKALGLDLRYGTTVLTVTTTKSGEREWNGVNYPEYTHEIAVDSNPGVEKKDDSAAF